MNKQEEDIKRTFIFVVYDIKTESYSYPFPSSRGSFENFINICVNDHTDHDWHLFTDDFIVYEYGEWKGGEFHLYEEAKIFNSLSAYRKSCKQCKKEFDAGNLHCKQNLKEDELMGKFQQNNFSFAKAAMANIQRSKFR